MEYTESKKRSDDPTILKLYEKLEDANLALGYMYQKKGMMSDALKKDFEEFCKIMRDTFEESPKNFSFNKVYGRIPKNKWIKKHHGYMVFLSNRT